MCQWRRGDYAKQGGWKGVRLTAWARACPVRRSPDEVLTPTSLSQDTSLSSGQSHLRVQRHQSRDRTTRVWARETPNKLGAGCQPVCDSWSCGQAVPGSEQQRALRHWGSSVSGEAFPPLLARVAQGHGRRGRAFGQQGAELTGRLESDRQFHESQVLAASNACGRSCREGPPGKGWGPARVLQGAWCSAASSCLLLRHPHLAPLPRPLGTQICA